MTECGNVYINAVGKFLPGDPITNSEAEGYLGKIAGQPSRLKALVLRKNKIKTRYYALDKEGEHLYSNVEMATLACKDAINNSQVMGNDIGYLATATTQGDLLVPGMASSVHAELGLPPVELANFQSVCASSMMALKSAYLQVYAGEHNTALVSASEFSSRWFRPGFYEAYFKKQRISQAPIETEFIRWTLSDGAGAVVLGNKPSKNQYSLKIDWVKQKSFADRFDNCMFAGTESNDPSLLKTWSSYADPGEAMDNGAMILRQDFDLLYRMFPAWLSFYIELIEQGLINIKDVDYFLGHYSADSLKKEMVSLMKKADVMVPEEKWFTNLYSKGNTGSGSASIFIMLEELLNEKELTPGQTILCFVPESGRCIVSFMKLTVCMEGKE